MTIALAGAAILGLAGAVTAVSARESRAALLGLTVALAAMPFVAEPLPEIQGLALRVVSAALASYLLWMVVRDHGADVGGSRLGWPAEALLATAAAVVGVSVAIVIINATPIVPGAGAGGLDGAMAGVAPAAIPTAAGAALLTLATTPVIVPRVPVRLGLGLILLVQGVTLLRTGLAGTPSALEELAISAAILAIAAGVAALVRIGPSQPGGRLVETMGHRRPAPAGRRRRQMADRQGEDAMGEILSDAAVEQRADTAPEPEADATVEQRADTTGEPDADTTGGQQADIPGGS
jgi:hypothetical protein